MCFKPSRSIEFLQLKTVVTGNRFDMRCAFPQRLPLSVQNRAPSTIPDKEVKNYALEVEMEYQSTHRSHYTVLSTSNKIVCQTSDTASQNRNNCSVATFIPRHSPQIRRGIELLSYQAMTQQIISRQLPSLEPELWQAPRPSLSWPVPSWSSVRRLREDSRCPVRLS